MPEIHFQNFLIVFAWSIAILWLIGFIWTIYCLKKQKTLEIKSDKIPANQTFVSILVPARNEAHRILEKSISSMLDQTYKNYELIVLNDRSTDNTREILEKLKTQNQTTQNYRRQRTRQNVARQTARARTGVSEIQKANGF